MAANTGATFESYIHYVYSTLLNLKGEQVQVSRRTIFRCADEVTYEVDIFYEFMHVGVRHRVAIECKDWAKPVDQGRIFEFHQKIKNIGSDIVGVFVSKAGYQSGAINAARKHGILTLKADDLPTIADLLASTIRATCLPDSRCIGEPFWYIAELSDDPDMDGTDTYYAFPETSPVRFPLFFSKRHAEVFWSKLPQKDKYAVFGMPQYKLRFLAAVAVQFKMKMGLVFEAPMENGAIAVTPIDAEQFQQDYLLVKNPVQ
jgi:hypothetical protein